MKKIITFLILILSTSFVFAIDKTSSEYLKNKRHFSPGKSLVENVVASGLKTVLRKETGANFKVKFASYSYLSMKKGIFKFLEITGNDVNVDGVVIPYVHLQSITDYNYIDYKADPIVFKSDMKFQYDLLIDELALNTLLAKKEYQKNINKVNKLSYPLFMVNSVSTKFINNRIYIIINYNFPVARVSKDRAFVCSTDFEVVNGEIKAKDVRLDSLYNKVSIAQVVNLLNLLSPLEFALDLLNTKRFDVNVENVKIVDNKIKVDGKIFVKGD